MSAMSPEEFVKWEKNAASIDFKLEYVDLAGGDIAAGLLLSQIVYWFLPSARTGKSKLTVQRDGFWWIAKTKEQWYQETRLKRAAFDTAVSELECRGLIRTRVFHFHDRRTLHINLNINLLLEKMAELIGSPDDQKP